MTRALGEAAVIAAGLFFLALDLVEAALTPREEREDREGRRLAAECGATWFRDVTPWQATGDDTRARLAMQRGV